MAFSPTTEASPPDDPGMNLTPMIDVVFQLLVFFLLALRFKTVDRRLESHLPKDRNCRTTTFVEEYPRIRVKLLRREGEVGPDASTRIRIGNRAAIDLPPPGDPTRPGAVERLRDMLFEIRVRGPQGVSAKGEIRTPRPGGLMVPHGDVMAVLDAFVRAGVADVTFEGTPMPHPRTR